MNLKPDPAKGKYKKTQKIAEIVGDENTRRPIIREVTMEDNLKKIGLLFGAALVGIKGYKILNKKFEEWGWLDND